MAGKQPEEIKRPPMPADEALKTVVIRDKDGKVVHVGSSVRVQDEPEEDEEDEGEDDAAEDPPPPEDLEEDGEEDAE